MSSAAQNSQDKSKQLEDYLSRADLIMDKRFLHFAFSCLGKNVEVQLEDGNKGQGKFYTSHLESGGVIVKNFSTNGDKNVDPSAVLRKGDFVYILAQNVEDLPLIRTEKNVFKTDTEISKNKTLDQRKLVKWNADEGDEEHGTGFVLEDLAPQSGKWNQFEVNEKRFGLTSHFREEMYTTQLDMGKVSEALLQQAERIEAEILNSTSDFGNRHIREERGLEALREEHEDEEFFYSSVYRSDSKKEAAPTKGEERKKMNFFNSKRETEPSKDTKGTENKKETAPASNTREPLASKAKPFESTQNEKPTIKQIEQIPETRGLSKQASNISEETPQNRQKARLSTKAQNFETPGGPGASDSKPKDSTPQAKPVEETKPKEEIRQNLIKQPSLGTDKDINLDDYNLQILQKFRIKKEMLKKSNTSFFEFVLPDFIKKESSISTTTTEPELKTPKSKPDTALSSASTSKSTTPSSSQQTTAPLNKPQHIPNPNAPAFIGGSSMYGNFGGMMMPGGMNPPMYNTPTMGNMVYMGQFPPAYYPGQQFPPYQQGFINPTHPEFNSGFSHGQRPNGPQNKQHKPYHKNN